METVEVGGDSWLTICQLAVTIPRDLTSAMPVWRDQALAATSTVVALLDERIAQEEVIEDLLVLDPAGQNVIAVVDHAERIRTFEAKNRMLPAHRAALPRWLPWIWRKKTQLWPPGAGTYEPPRQARHQIRSCFFQSRWRRSQSRHTERS